MHILKSFVNLCFWLCRPTAIVFLLSVLTPVYPLLASTTCQTNKTLSVPTEYQKLAEATGGSALRLDEGEMGQIPANLLIDITPREHVLKLTKIFQVAEPITLPIDSYVEQLKLHISTHQPMQFELLTPDNQTLQETTNDIVMHTYSSGCIIILEKPKPGT